jgi:thiol-disulfide isomerase/thioredoxin
LKRRPVLVLAAGAAAAAAGLATFAWRQRQGDEGDAGDKGNSALWQTTFERPEGGQLRLASFSGQVLVVNFWATWCPPCIKELPEFDRLHQAWSGRGVQVVGIAVDTAQPVRQFLAKQPVRFAVALAGFAGTDMSRQLGNEKGGLPFTVVFDRQRRLRHRKLGETEFAELDRWLKAL